MRGLWGVCMHAAGPWPPAASTFEHGRVYALDAAACRCCRWSYRRLTSAALGPHPSLQLEGVHSVTRYNTSSVVSQGCVAAGQGFMHAVQPLLWHPAASCGVSTVLV